MASMPRARAASMLTCLSSMNRASSGRVPSFSSVEMVDGRIGLGDIVLEAPDEHVETREPVEFALDVVQHRVAHVGEDGGADAVLLECGLPGKHGGALRRPHAGIQAVEFVDGGGIEVELGVADELLPELQGR